MAKVGIAGHGYVGRAVEFGFKKANEILIYDIKPPSLPLEEFVASSDYIFLCLPTPMDEKYRHIDLSIVDDVYGKIVAIAKKEKVSPVIIIKSTVIPGTTRNLSKKYAYTETAFNPEFFTEANYLQDFMNSDRIIIGADNNSVRGKVVQLYREVLPATKIFETDPTTAEMVKYMANTYLATKVIFGNETYDLCEKLGIKYEEVKEMVVADHRIYDSHLNVTSERGFGQKCFPKDTVALLGLAQELGVNLSVLRAAWEKNLKIRKVRDWEHIPGAVSRKNAK